MGKVLFVDLSSCSFEERNIPDHVYQKYLSGAGLGAYILYKEIPRGANPLGPDNILGFVSGLLTGTGSLVTGRWLAVCKSPLTGGWGDANCGGTLSPAIKQCDYDGIFFRGASKKPVYLLIDEEGPRLEDAEELWGKDAVESEDHLKEKHGKGKKPSVAVIGQAAEKLSLISGICNDRGRIAARSGVGAVMGSKKLKALVLKGSHKIEAADREKVRSLSKSFAAKVKKVSFPGFVRGSMLAYGGKAMGKLKFAMALDGMMSVIPIFKRWGTIYNNTFGVTSGDSPVKNWGGSAVDYNKASYKKLNPDLIIKRESKKYSCYSCVIGCGGICEISDLRDGRFKETHKPEYETCAAFGPLLMNRDLDSIFYINELLNRAGMDTISAGSTVAYAIECYENGLITVEDTGGLELNWGNSEAIIGLIQKMISREGIGDRLADGVSAAVDQLGIESKKFAMHAGGQEPGMHDPRFDPQFGVHYSADPTPGRHTIGSNQYYLIARLWEKVSWAPRITRYAKKDEYIASEHEALKAFALACYKQVVDGSGGCLFAAISGVQHWPIFEWLNAATGWQKTADEYMEIGHRIQTLRQMFNVREGIRPIDFMLPDRIVGSPPLEAGPLKGKSFPLEQMIENYWKHFGWDEKSGKPLEETITRLELDSERANKIIANYKS